MKTLLLYSSVVVAGVVIGTGCRSPLPGHCFNEEGDRTCGEGRFCNRCLPEGDGCVDAMPSEECHFPGPAEDGSSSSGEAPSGEATMTPAPTTDSEMSGTTGPTPCTDEGDCPTDAAPFCDTSRGECVPCDVLMDPDGACAALDAETPLCVNGSCAECRPEEPLACDADLAVCDSATNSCVPCTEHGQCSSGACELAAGRCFPAGQIVYIDEDPQALFDGVEAVAAGGFRVFVVNELDDDAPYNAVHVADGKTIALLAAPNERPRIAGTGGDPGVRVQGPGTSLYVDGLRVAGNLAGRGVELDMQALAWLDRSHIVQNANGGISAATGAELTLRNCFVGDLTHGAHGLLVDGASSYVLSTTLGAGFTNFAEVFPLRCTGTVDVSIRNGLLVSFDEAAEISCGAATVTNTAAEALIPGAGNVALGDVQADWFTGAASGDFSLGSPPALLGTTARWNDNDPTTDINGDLRPTIDGSPDYAGADRLP